MLHAPPWRRGVARTRRIALRTSRQCRRLATGSTVSRSSCSTAWHLDDMGRPLPLVGWPGWGGRGGRGGESPVLNRDWGMSNGGGQWHGGETDRKTLPAVPSAVVPGAAVGSRPARKGTTERDVDGIFGARACAVVDTLAGPGSHGQPQLAPLGRGTGTESELRLRIA